MTTKEKIATGIFIVGWNALTFGSVWLTHEAEKEKRNRVKIGNFDFSQKQYQKLEELQKHPDQLIFQAPHKS